MEAFGQPEDEAEGTLEGPAGEIFGEVADLAVVAGDGEAGRAAPAGVAVGTVAAVGAVAAPVEEPAPDGECSEPQPADNDMTSTTPTLQALKPMLNRTPP